jgi:hypothetical protein
MTAAARRDDRERDEPVQYTAAHVHDALARDPRASDQSVDVRIADGQVFLTGDAASEAQRDAITAVVAELCPDLEVRNDVVVVAPVEGGRVEELG